MAPQSSLDSFVRVHFAQGGRGVRSPAAAVSRGRGGDTLSSRDRPHRGRSAGQSVGWSYRTATFLAALSVTVSATWTAGSLTGEPSLSAP